MLAGKKFPEGHTLDGHCEGVATITLLVNEYGAKQALKVVSGTSALAQLVDPPVDQMGYVPARKMLLVKLKFTIGRATVAPTENINLGANEARARDERKG